MARDPKSALRHVLDEPSNGPVDSSVVISTESSGTGVRPATLALGALLFTAATVLPLFRQTGARSWQTTWAEDGTIYFGQANLHGGFAVLLRGYAGYLQLPLGS